MLSLLAVLVLTPAGAGPTQITAQIGKDSWKVADDFFAANTDEPVKPIVRRAYATYIEARRAYKAKEYRRCQNILDELWRDLPMGDPKWWGADPRPVKYSLGNPACYPTLLMLDEACHWRLDPESAKVKPVPILMDVVLFGHSEGIQPHTAAELAARQGEETVHDLNPILLQNDYARLRSVLWLFQDYILAITKGHANLELQFVPLPDATVHMEVDLRQLPTGPLAFAVPNEPMILANLTALQPTLKRQPDWWWTIMPSQVPDEFPDFKHTEFISGGNSVGPDGHSMKLSIDDKWLVRRLPHMGQGKYDPLELEAYMPYWLCHEFYHHVFFRFSEFELEKTGHIWHDRTKWPADFTGNFEPDYYRESLHKRVQPQGNPPLDIRLRYAPPSADDLAKIQLSDILGAYRLKPVVDAWHEGEIVTSGSDDNGNPNLKWQNKAGVSWPLYLSVRDGALTSISMATGKENPYMKLPNETAHRFDLELARDESGRFTRQVRGYWFQGEFFEKY